MFLGNNINKIVFYKFSKNSFNFYEWEVKINSFNKYSEFFSKKNQVVVNKVYRCVILYRRHVYT